MGFVGEYQREIKVINQIALCSPFIPVLASISFDASFVVKTEHITRCGNWLSA